MTDLKRIQIEHFNNHKLYRQLFKAFYKGEIDEQLFATRRESYSQDIKKTRDLLINHRIWGNDGMFK